MRNRTFRNVSQFMQQKGLLVLLGAAFWLGLIGLAFFSNTSCSDVDDYKSSKVPSTDIHFLEIETKVDMGSIFTIEEMLAAAGQDGNLYLWNWQNISKEPKVIELDPDSWIPKWRDRPPLINNKVCTLLSQRWIIHASHEEQDTILIFQEVEGQKEVNRWATGKGWYCEQLRSTYNGKYVAVCLDDDLNHSVEGVSRRGNQLGYRLGIIGTSPIDIQWMPTFFRRDSTLPALYAVAASEDGNNVCIVGNIDRGWIMLADVVHKKVVWEKTPQGEDILYGRWTVAFKDVCFSPDGKCIYVAGNCGLFCFDTATGKIIKQWPMGLAVSVAVSPDERLVAVGMLNNDDVYICDVNSANPVGVPVLKLETGQPNVSSLAFSPDSKFLATEGIRTNNIKIWKMPPPALETKTATQKNE